MGLLDGLIGGAAGAGLVTVVNGLIEKHGGLQGIVAQFQQTGPWTNHPILGWNRGKSADLARSGSTGFGVR